MPSAKDYGVEPCVRVMYIRPIRRIGAVDAKRALKACGRDDQKPTFRPRRVPCIHAGHVWNFKICTTVSGRACPGRKRPRSESRFNRYHPKLKRHFGRSSWTGQVTKHKTQNYEFANTIHVCDLTAAGENVTKFDAKIERQPLLLLLYTSQQRWF